MDKPKFNQYNRSVDDIRRMERRDKAIWYLYIKAGFTMQEIADVFKVTRDNVKKRLDKKKDEYKSTIQLEP